MTARLRGYLAGLDHRTPEPSLGAPYAERFGFAEGRLDLNRSPSTAARIVRESDNLEVTR